MLAQQPKIQTQFADLKRALSVVTDEQWERIPDVGNLTKKPKVPDFGKTYAVPDSVIVGDRNRAGFANSLDIRQQKVCLLASHPHNVVAITSLLQYGGFETSVNADALTNLVEMGQARDKFLSLKLDQASCSFVPFIYKDTL